MADPSRLQTIATEHNAKIEVYRPNNVVRITGNRALCLAVEAAVRAELHGRSTEEVDLEPVEALLRLRGANLQSDLFQRRDLDEIERMTNTSIEVIRSSSVHKVCNFPIFTVL